MGKVWEEVSGSNREMVQVNINIMGQGYSLENILRMVN